MGGSHISLFSGVGMTDLAAEAFGFETLVTAEIAEWNRRVLRTRFPDAVHEADVRDVRADTIGVEVQRPLLVTGGFPCQDISLAGHGAGLDGARSGLWSELRRVVQEFRPEYVLAENVAALRGRGLDRVVRDLTDLGYNVRWDCLPAAAVGAPHMRDRMFIAAVREDVEWEPVPDGTVDADNFIGLVTDQGVARPDQTDPNDLFVAKLPRAGAAFCDGGRVYECDPLATQRDVKKALGAGEMLLPSPSKSEPGWRNLTILDRDGNPPAHPNQRFYCGDTGRVVQKGVAQVAQMFPDLKPASLPLLPSPTRQEGKSGPGRSPKRTGGPNLRTVVNEQNGDYKLNPRWVEWMMGLPEDWTNPDVENGDLRPFEGWQEERLPRTDPAAPHRRKRLEACGNGLVPQVAHIPLAWMLGAIR